MATYTIIRIYEVPANNRIQATDRLLEAMRLGVEEDYHVKDVCPGARRTFARACVPETGSELEQLALEATAGCNRG